MSEKTPRENVNEMLVNEVSEKLDILQKDIDKRVDENEKEVMRVIHHVMSHKLEIHELKFSEKIGTHIHILNKIADNIGKENKELEKTWFDIWDHPLFGCRQAFEKSEEFARFMEGIVEKVESDEDNPDK